MGVVIKSSEMAKGIAEVVDEQLPFRAWRIGRDEKGGLTWTSVVDGETVVETSEPNVSLGRKLQAFFLKAMPESQL
jgi:hypothetical protein